MINEIAPEDRFSGLGLARDGIKDRTADGGEVFSRLMNEAREKQQAAVAGSVSDAAPRVVPREAHIDKTDKLYETCLSLETFVVKNILNAMRNNVMKSSLIDTGYAGEIYEDMLWDEYAKEYTKNAGFGLADLAYLELTGQRGRKV